MQNDKTDTRETERKWEKQSGGSNENYMKNALKKKNVTNLDD